MALLLPVDTVNCVQTLKALEELSEKCDLRVINDMLLDQMKKSVLQPL
jgi:hypothetical protein